MADKTLYMDDELHGRLKAAAALAGEKLSPYGAKVIEAGLKAIEEERSIAVVSDDE